MPTNPLQHLHRGKALFDCLTIIPQLQHRNAQPALTLTLELLPSTAQQLELRQVPMCIVLGRGRTCILPQVQHNCADAAP